MAWPVLIAVGIVAVAEWACSGGEEPSNDVVPDAYTPDLLKPDAIEDAGADQDTPERPDVKDSGADEYVGDADAGQELDSLICGDDAAMPDEPTTDDASEDTVEVCEDAIVDDSSVPIDNGRSDEGADITPKRALLNCSGESDISVCWDRLTQTGYQADVSLIDLSIEFVDSTEPCDLEAGINMCLSSAITTCPEDTLIDIGSPEFRFVTSYFNGAQNLFASADGEIEIRADKTTDPLMLSLRVSGIEGLDGECKMLWTTFECINACK